MKHALISLIVLFVAACGTPTPSNNNTGNPDAGNNSASDAAGDNASNGGTNGVNVGGECADIGDRFKEAVRAMPRNCATDADCKIVSRANVCDCDLAVTASSDTADHDAIRTELDDAVCENPFGCAVEQCPYRRLSEPGELYAHCNDANECEIVQILPCSEFEARKSGGIAPPGGCMDAAGCTIRADLNPCGCGEAVSINFPALAVQPIAEMIEINEERCGLTCEGCNAPGAAVCGDDGMGNMVCMTQ